MHILLLLIVFIFLLPFTVVSGGCDSSFIKIGANFSCDGLFECPNIHTGLAIVQVRGVYSNSRVESYKNRNIPHMFDNQVNVLGQREPWKLKWPRQIKTIFRAK